MEDVPRHVEFLRVFVDRPHHGKEERLFAILATRCDVAGVASFKGVVFAMTIKLKRVYDQPSQNDGYRILVDRLWPRGLSEERADVDLWLRRIAPSTDLRKWYGHDVDKWPQFQERYESELAEHGELLDLIGDIQRHRKIVTILYGAKDEQHNEADVLVDVLKRRLARTSR